MATGVTLEQITTAADKLLARGERPTVEAVRKELGTGAPVTVNRLLRDYFATLPRRLDLPADLAAAAANLMKVAQEAGLVEVRRVEAERKAELQVEAERLAREQAALAGERQALGERIAVLETEIGQARRDLDAASKRIGALQGDVEVARQAQGVAEEAARNAIAERERTAEQLRGELRHQREAHAQNEADMKAQIGDLQDRLAKAADAREKAREHAETRIKGLEAKVDALNAELSEQRRQGIAVSADLAREQRARTAADTALAGVQAQLVVAKEQATRDSASAAEQRAQLQAQLVTAQRESRDARAERDLAVRTAATLQGRVEALEAQIKQVIEANARAREAGGSDG